MAVTVRAAFPSGTTTATITGGGVNTNTTSVTTAAGDVLVVHAVYNDSPDTGASLSCTFNAVAADGTSSVLHSNTNQTVGFEQVFYFLNPAVTTANVVVTQSGGTPDGMEVKVYALAGTNNSAPTFTLNAPSGTGTSTAVTVTSVSVASGIVLGHFCAGASFSSVNNTQQVIAQNGSAIDAANAIGGNSAAGTGSNVTMTGTLSGADFWAAIASSWSPAGGTVSSTPMPRLVNPRRRPARLGRFILQQGIATGQSIGLTGVSSDLALASPAGSVSTVVAITGVVAALTLAAPAGTVSVQTNVTQTGVVSNLALAAPAGSVAAVSNVTLTGAVANLALSAPAGTVAATANVSLTGAVANLAFAAPAGTVSVQKNITLTGVVSNLAFAAPAGTFAMTVAQTGVVTNVTFGAPAGTVSTGGAVALTGVVTGLALSAPAGTVSTVVALTGVVSPLALSAPAGTVALTKALTGVTAPLALSAPAGTVSTRVSLVGATASLLLAAPAGTFVSSGALAPGTQVDAQVILRIVAAETITRTVPAEVVARTQDAEVIGRTVQAEVISRTPGADVTVPQDYSASKTWTLSFAKDLAQPALVGVTISSCTATVPVQPTGGTVTAANATVTGSNTAVSFRVSQTGLTTPTNAVVVIGVTLSNGDTDQRDFTIQFTNT